MRLLKPVLSLSVLFSFSYAMNCSLVQNVKKWGGHYYTITTKRLTWQQAMEFAKENGGYLAIPNSAAENAFLQSLIPKPKYAWIGIYDPNYMTNYCYDDTHCAFDDSRFETVKGQPLTYKNWAEYQPDNLVMSYDVFQGKQLVSPLGEHWVAMASTNGKWADFGNHADKYNNPVKFFALIEFDKMPDCYTPESNVTDEYQGAKCNTQIYDDKTGNLQEGQTYTCLKDKYGNYYCPAELAPCGQEWQYKDGYSKKVVKEKYEIYVENKLDIKHPGTCIGEACGMFHTTYYFYVSDLSKVQEFKLVHTGWDDYLRVLVNGKQVSNDPFGGNILKIIASGTTWYQGKKYNRGIVEYDTSGKYASCELYDWHTRNYNKDVKELLVKGTNTIELFNVIGACGGGRAVFIYKAKKGVISPIKCEGYHSCKNTIVKTYKVKTDYSYYEYLCSGTNKYGEPYEPIVKEGNSPTPPPNNCRAKSFVCKPAPDRKCVWVDNKWQCSPFPCFGEGAGNYNVENTDTPTGINDANNNGWNANGTCSGTIYIFNGKDMRCRSEDAFFGLTGGGCCDKDKVFFGLVQCKEEEKLLAKKRENNVCHYIGEYCSKKIKIIGCVQKKKTYCCFNSLLARIINEQGRPQLHKGWGSPESPNCRGFTPEEFQKLDFSKMDLSKFYKQISQSISQNVLNNMTQYMKNSIETQLQNIQGK